MQEGVFDFHSLMLSQIIEEDAEFIPLLTTEEDEAERLKTRPDIGARILLYLRDSLTEAKSELSAISLVLIELRRD